MMSEKRNNQEQPNALLASRSSQTVGEYIRSYFQRIRSGDLGAIPIIFGLIVIAVIFQTQNEHIQHFNLIICNQYLRTHKIPILPLNEQKTDLQLLIFVFEFAFHPL